MDFKLCYISDKCAYFTTQDIADQWGDDWNDAPYEHNAGEPYLPTMHDTEHWDIDQIFYRGGFETPADVGNGNSPWSVDDINKHRVPWLTFHYWDRDPKTTNWIRVDEDKIYAGATREEFIGFIKKHGGRVWLESGADLEEKEERKQWKL